MKIAHVTSELGRRSAGHGAAVAAMSAATEESGNEVRVFGLSSPDWVDGDNSTWSGAPTTVFETTRWSGPLRYAPGMSRTLRDFRPDVIHLHGLWTYPSIAVLRWHQETGCPYVVSAHGMLMPESLEYKPIRKAAARRLFQDKVLQASSILHATSVDEESAYRDLGFNHRSEVIPLGLNTVALPEIDRAECGRRVLFLGRLHRQKGIDLLVEAWVALENEFPDWELSIVGPLDPSFAEKMEQIRLLASGRRVSFLPPVYGDEKYQFMASSDLFVMPSRSENFGLTAAEALMMEVPVVATKGTPWSGLVDVDAGWWIEPRAVALEQSLREAMLLPDAERRRKGRNGRRWIERDFSWSVIGKKWQRLYEELFDPDNA